MPLWEEGRLLTIYRHFQVAVLAFCALCFALALAAAPVVASWLLPASFSGSSLLVLVLLPSSLTALLNFPWTVSFLMFSHPRFLMLFDACALAVLGFIYWHCITRYGALGAAAVTSVFAVIKAAALQLLAIETLKKHPRVKEGHIRLTAAEPSVVS
jgi:O-antigen/teichoic acid export membrane protein